MIKRIKVESDLINYIERLYLEYQSRKDIITSIFEGHKYDTDSTILESVPFQHYEKKFAESKLAYEIGMSEIEEQVVPAELRLPTTTFTVDFQSEEVVITTNE